MTINDELLQRLEKLSAIHIEDSKKDEVKAQLNEILHFVENLNSIDLPDEIPHRSAHTAIRDDVVKNANIADFVLDNAPDSKDRFFIVPKIVE